MTTTVTQGPKVEKVVATSAKAMADKLYADYGIHMERRHAAARVALFVKTPAGLMFRLRTRGGLLLHSELMTVGA
jgi:hypothetical protein